MNFDQKNSSAGILQGEGKLMSSTMHENRFARPVMKKTPEGTK